MRYIYYTSALCPAGPKSNRVGSRGRERKSPGHLPSDLSKVGKYTIIGDQCLNPALSTHGNYPGIGLEGARVWDADSQKDPGKL